MLERGQRIPNWRVEDAQGRSQSLWDFRQKAHLLLLYDPKAPAQTLERWQKAVQADQRQWDWLNTRVIIVGQAPKEVVPGAYIVDRYGMFWNYYSPGNWTFDDLERDLVYYEAAHC